MPCATPATQPPTSHAPPTRQIAPQAHGGGADPPTAPRASCGPFLTRRCTRRQPRAEAPGDCPRYAAPLAARRLDPLRFALGAGGFPRTRPPSPIHRAPRAPCLRPAAPRSQPSRTPLPQRRGPHLPGARSPVPPRHGGWDRRPIRHDLPDPPPVFQFPFPSPSPPGLRRPRPKAAGDDFFPMRIIVGKGNRKRGAGGYINASKLRRAETASEGRADQGGGGSAPRLRASSRAARRPRRACRLAPQGCARASRRRSTARRFRRLHRPAASRLGPPFDAPAAGSPSTRRPCACAWAAVFCQIRRFRLTLAP